MTTIEKLAAELSAIAQRPITPPQVAGMYAKLAHTPVKAPAAHDEISDADAQTLRAKIESIAASMSDPRRGRPTRGGQTAADVRAHMREASGQW